MGDRFYFTITDAARFLNKSPVTLRQWERKGVASFPRESEGGDRRFTAEQVLELAWHAYSIKRISKARLHLVIGAVQLIELVEVSSV